MTERRRPAYRRDSTAENNDPEETTMNPIHYAKKWLSYRRTVAELSNLPSHTLADIGLTRYDIRAAAARRAH